MSGAAWRTELGTLLDSSLSLGSPEPNPHCYLHSTGGTPCALIEGFSHRQFTKNLEELKDGMHFALLFFFLFYYYFSTFSLTIYYLNATAKGQKAANLDLKKKMKMVRMRFTETSSYLVSRRKGGVLTAAPVSSGVASAGEQDAEQEDGGRPRR